MSVAPESGRVRTRLLGHFDRHKRQLPWRVERTPYRVLVSEFMLQQTRVDTVLPYYSRWLSRFPDFEALARASVDDVLREWQGLGYYSRARNLHRLAVVVRERYGGDLPGELEKLRELPGVGEYTAGAVASIVFGQIVPAVDGNVRRVLSRLYDLPAPSASELRNLAGALVDPERPGDFNEALMELGATVCAHRGPDCGNCPVSEDCQAHGAGTTESRPLPTKRRTAPAVEFAVAVVMDCQRRTLLVRRPGDGLLADMWEFPTVDCLAALGFVGEVLGTLPAVRHTFTHLKATYRSQLLRLSPDGQGPPEMDRPKTATASPESCWLSLDDLDRVPLPVAQQRIGGLAREWLRTHDWAPGDSLGK